MNEILLLLGCGVFAGLLAGMFGIGGGLVIVPLLTVLFSSKAMEEELILPIAIGTSLCTISLTALASAWGHYKNDGINFSYFKQLVFALIIGTILGGIIAPALPAIVLGSLIGSYCLIASYQTLRSRVGVGAKAANLWQNSIAGVGIGFLSSMFGIGGGNFLVPYLNWVGCRPHRCIGTAAACGIPIAIPGALTYALWNTPVGDALPEQLVGFVYWKAALIIAITSMPSARLAAWFNSRLPPRAVRNTFASYLLLVGLYMIVRNDVISFFQA